MTKELKISDYDYPLPEERIARYPLAERDASKLLVYRDGVVSETRFTRLPELLPAGSLTVFNNTRVIRARIVFFKETGARIEVFCLEPADPADYERAFACRETCRWHGIVGNLKKWKEGPLSIRFEHEGKPSALTATLVENRGKEHLVEFRWDADLTFGQLLEWLGRMPIPPYLNRDTQEIDLTRYQTVYSRFEGSVAAPTAGLHFTPAVIDALHGRGIATEEVTLHVGAGTFLPVKDEDATHHVMHTEHFEIRLDTLRRLAERPEGVTAVGTTSVRTLESLPVLGYRVRLTGTADEGRAVGQWEAYGIPESLTGPELLESLIGYLERRGLEKLKSATQIMITPAGFRFRIVSALVTNFHQPKSTLLLLIAAFVGEDRWRDIYRFALQNGFRFLSYGDSSLLFRPLR